MPLRFDAPLWRARALTLIFVGVTLAFVFEGWRKQLDEASDVRQTIDGLILAPIIGAVDVRSVPKRVSRSP